MRPFMFLCFATLMLQKTESASLSLYEQKKYKQFLDGQGLYTPEDDVVVLTVNNFKSEVMHSPQAWLVEFYNSWCGFCQRFAPSWKALATDLKGWSDRVKISALDCSVDENAPLCRDYEIMAYPTLRYFHENYSPGPQSLGVALQKGEDEAGHRLFLIERLVTEQREKRGSHFPNLLPLNATTLEGLFTSVPGSVEYVFVVVERPGSFLGAQVALDLHKNANIVVRYSESNNTALLEKYGIVSIPTILTLSRGGKLDVLSSVESRQEVKKSISDFLHKKSVEVKDDTPKTEIFTGKWLDVEVPDMAAVIQERARQALQEKIKRIGDVVFQMDLETALRYSLNHEVATVKQLEGEKLQALRNYIAVLQKYFPFGQRGRYFLYEVSLKLADSAVSGAAIGELVAKAEKEQAFSSLQTWLACRGSSGSLRGYPCGLWKLFHFLTVNAAEQNANNRRTDPLEVLNAMHGYVKHFFGCQDCSQHFLEMAERRQMKTVSSLDSSVLWLWMAHNEVNKRLSGDQTEDPEYPKVQFPEKGKCPLCRKEDGNYELDEVLKYLKHMYSGLNVRYIGSDTTVLHAGLESSHNASGMLNLDISMCFVLYVISFFLLALLIRLFLKRGYKKKPYVHDLLGKV